MLIHALGGLTAQESMESDYNSYEMGAFMVACKALCYAKQLNGLNADEWCEKMCRYLEWQEKEHSKMPC